MRLLYCRTKIILSSLPAAAHTLSSMAITIEYAAGDEAQPPKYHFHKLSSQLKCFKSLFVIGPHEEEEGQEHGENKV